MNERKRSPAQTENGPLRLKIHDLRRLTEGGSAPLLCGPSWRSLIYGD